MHSPHCKLWCIVLDTTQDANRTIVRVINTTQCQILHQVVWYVQFIITAYH